MGGARIRVDAVRRVLVAALVGTAAFGLAAELLHNGPYPDAPEELVALWSGGCVRRSVSKAARSGSTSGSGRNGERGLANNVRFVESQPRWARLTLHNSRALGFPECPFPT